MPPLERRRRRSSVPVVATGVVAALLLALLIGGALKVSAASGPYRRAVNRSYAAQASIVMVRSTADGAQLATLMNKAPTMDRVALQEALATLVAGTAAQAATSRTMVPPDPTGGTGQQVTGVLGARAQAVAQVSAAMEGVLGIGATGGVVPAESQTKAVSQLAAAGRVLAQADRAYAATRHRFASAPGNPRLPASVWVHDPALWTPGPLQTLVSQLAGSSTLAAVYRVVLVPNALGLQPGPLPPVGGGTATTSVVPTKTLVITAVVANQGNVAVRGIRVSATATPVGGGAASSASGSVDLAAGTSSAVTLPALAVVPGDTYTVVVAVSQPAGQTDRSAGSTVFSVRIAPLPPPTPATTTTTTTTTTTAPAHSGATRTTRPSGTRTTGGG